MCRLPVALARLPATPRLIRIDINPRIQDFGIVVVKQRLPVFVAQDQTEGDIRVIALMIKLFPPPALIVVARVLERVIAYIDERFDPPYM